VPPAPSRRLVRSSSNARLLGAAAEFLPSLDHECEVVVIAQSRGAADDFVRGLGGAGSVGVHRTTLTGLAADLAEAPLAAAGLSPLTGLSTEALVARIIHRLKARSIPYFNPVADTPGLARAVAATLKELRLEGVRPEDVASTGAPGADLARIAAMFDESLTVDSLADFALLMRHAIAIARTGGHRLLGLPVLLLDVDLAFDAHRQLAAAIVARAPSALAACLAGDARNIAAFESLLGVTAESPHVTGGTTLDRVRESLFAPVAAPAGNTDGAVEYFSAAGEALECVEIARRIRKLAESGVAFDRAAILLRAPDRYQTLVEEALRRAGIPAFFSRGVARPDPAGRAFMALLACAAEGCSATRFAEYLSLGQAPPLDRRAGPGPFVLPSPEDEVLRRLYESNGPVPEPAVDSGPPEDADSAVIAGTLATPAAWEKLLVDAAVIGGHARWVRRLRGLEAEFRMRLAELDREDQGRHDALLRQIARLKNLERFALPLIEMLATLPAQAAWGEWLDGLERLAAAGLRRPDSVLSVLSELQAMAEVGPVGLDEVTGVLSDRLRFLRNEPPLRRYGKVFVGSIDDARGRSFDVVFLPGLCEGLFPARALEDPILLDEHRRKLTGKLRLQEHRVADERCRLHIACGAARDRLVFSYPRIDVAESRPRVPSFYALEILRSARGCLPELRTFEEEARRGAPSRLDWPAPAEPLDAIDDAEFDIATLGRMLILPPEEARARGHYMIAANDHLVRSLRAEARRSRHAWSPADGLAEPDQATRDVLARYRLAARCYSPSALQHFSACPYRFLLHGIHQLRPREQKSALEQLDPATRGALFHEVQRRLFGELQASQLLPMRPAELPRTLALADRILDGVAAENEEELAPAIPRVWRAEIENLRADLRGWIQQASAQNEGWVPAHFEYSFGMALDASRDPSSARAEAMLAKVRLRGAIDLIEKHPERGTLRITDHKTGKVPQPRPAYVGGGEYLQPLAYALAAESLLGLPVEMSRLYYCTERGGYQDIPFEISPKTKGWFNRAMDIIDGEIDRGFLPAAPKAGACDYCEYLPVCGPHQEKRVSRKNKSQLEALQDLRNLA
jgi:ATP-dependent helicase/nuclease subunit B